MTPMCAAPRAPPPDKTRPIFGRRASAAAVVSLPLGVPCAIAAVAKVATVSKTRYAAIDRQDGLCFTSGAQPRNGTCRAAIGAIVHESRLRVTED